MQSDLGVKLVQQKGKGSIKVWVIVFHQATKTQIKS